MSAILKNKSEDKMFIKERIKNIIKKLDMFAPYILVGSGLISTLYSPSMLKNVAALLLAYVLLRDFMSDAKKPGREKQSLAKKLDETRERVLEKTGFSREDLLQLKKKEHL